MMACARTIDAALDQSIAACDRAYTPAGASDSADAKRSQSGRTRTQRTQSAHRTDAERMQSGCRADAERMQSGCRADAERRAKQSGRRANAERP